ncbi:MAG TPA: hypothetical protein VE954_01470 [Oligoflexus sp.]|uniref:hypothetical protein n=1 Tax=Oligoflexus sp. TaxID=1971216 RepID=UPI002D4312B1|nr:hypothetical protein [Oligoflexus sp.]HYX31752.1 hypothetical protein [Oligoflexus sp.]
MRTLFLILALAGGVQPAAAKNETTKPETAPAARPTMQKYAENVAILLQNLRPFDDQPSQQQKQSVQQALSTLKSLSHDVKPTLDLYAVDPIMRYLSLDLSHQFQKINDAYTAGNYPYARYVLRQTTQYCVGCHAASSLKHSATLVFKEPSGSMNELERAEYFTATRRHEDAMLAYERFLSDKKFKKSQPELWERAVQNLMSITIRIRQDASMTLEMISALLDEGGYTPQQTEMLQVWRTSAKGWQLDPPDKKLKGAEALEKSRQLISKAQKLSERRHTFGFIESMRAASLLNDVALGDSTDEVKAEAYLLTGQTSENLRDVFLWMRPEAYYEACIRIKPKSPTAKECAKQWEFYQKNYPTEAWDKEKFQQVTELTR